MTDAAKMVAFCLGNDVTDPAQLDTLNGLFRPAAASIAETAAKQGFDIRTSTRGEFADLVKRDIARLGAMIKDIGIQPI